MSPAYCTSHGSGDDFGGDVVVVVNVLGIVGSVGEVVNLWAGAVSVR